MVVLVVAAAAVTAAADSRHDDPQKVGEGPAKERSGQQGLSRTFKLAPLSRPYRQPLVKKSPAPIVSTTGTLAAAVTAVCPSAAGEEVAAASGSSRAKSGGGKAGRAIPCCYQADALAVLPHYVKHHAVRASKTCYCTPCWHAPDRAMQPLLPRLTMTVPTPRWPNRKSWAAATCCSAAQPAGSGSAAACEEAERAAGSGGGTTGWVGLPEPVAAGPPVWAGWQAQQVSAGEVTACQHRCPALLHAQTHLAQRLCFLLVAEHNVDKALLKDG